MKALLRSFLSYSVGFVTIMALLSAKVVPDQTTEMRELESYFKRFVRKIEIDGKSCSINEDKIRLEAPFGKSDQWIRLEGIYCPLAIFNPKEVKSSTIIYRQVVDSETEELLYYRIELDGGVYKYVYKNYDSMSRQSIYEVGAPFFHLELDLGSSWYGQLASESETKRFVELLKSFCL